MDYGVWTLVPVLLVIVFALKTKRTLESLIFGTMLTYVITNAALLPVEGVDALGHIPSDWMDAFFRVATDYSHQWVFLVCALFGSLITLLGASHGTLGFTKILGRLCRGPKSTMLVTWIMGILIFVDDYLNIMTLSTCMKKLTDQRKVPREALSYIIDSTGAPVCAILPFSTWAIFFSGLFFAQPGVADLGYGSAMETFYHVIPFTFYAIAAVIIVPLFIMGFVPKIGRMRTAYRRLRETGKVYSPESAALNEEDDESEFQSQGNIIDFVLPVGVLIALAIFSGELFLAVVAAIGVCFILYIPRGKMSFTKFCDLSMHGFCNMIPTVAIIFFAFVMQEAMSDIGIANYIITLMQPYINAVIFPLVTFLVVALLNFSTGSVWGIPAIVAPILLPLAQSVDANLVLVMGAIVSGATLGSHACFYSDATVLTSSCCKMENMDHALSQIPYALCATGISAVGYLACGMLM
ncbi:Na+/H+ antiporter NhaC family protein [Flintibacter sp.]|jgi:hypothetical protein|uniref:Na+/H+ antiporter NhaC family protein n=1 Tax=Flintibacter sp. TaxID=1918624 RepID=UPI003A3A31B2